MKREKKDLQLSLFYIYFRSDVSFFFFFSPSQSVDLPGLQAGRTSRVFTLQHAPRLPTGRIQPCTQLLFLSFRKKKKRKDDVIWGWERRLQQHWSELLLTLFSACAVHCSFVLKKRFYFCLIDKIVFMVFYFNHNTSFKSNICRDLLFFSRHVLK